MAKKHNWTTGPNNKVVDRDTEKAALRFLNNCGHLTPKKMAELDNLLSAMKRKPKTEDANTVCEPNPVVIAVLEEPPEPDWMDGEPVDAELKEIEREQAADVASK